MFGLVRTVRTLLNRPQGGKPGNQAEATITTRIDSERVLRANQSPVNALMRKATENHVYGERFKLQANAGTQAFINFMNGESKSPHYCSNDPAYSLKNPKNLKTGDLIITTEMIEDSGDRKTKISKVIKNDEKNQKIEFMALGEESYGQTVEQSYDNYESTLKADPRIVPIRGFENLEEGDLIVSSGLKIEEDRTFRAVTYTNNKNSGIVSCITNGIQNGQARASKDEEFNESYFLLHLRRSNFITVVPSVDFEQQA